MIGGTHGVLVQHGSRQFREMATRALGRTGIPFVMTARSDVSLRWLHEHPDGFALIAVDMDSDRKSAELLIRQIEESDMSLAILLISCAPDIIFYSRRETDYPVLTCRCTPAGFREKIIGVLSDFIHRPPKPRQGPNVGRRATDPIQSRTGTARSS